MAIFLLQFFSPTPLIYAQQAKVKITEENSSLSRILDEFSHQSKVRLVYSSTGTDSIRVTVKTNDRPGPALKKILRTTPYDFLQPADDLWLIVPKGETVNLPGRITGKVIDAKTGAGVQTANVFLYKTNHGTPTDSEGEFFLQNIEPGTYKLVVNRIGYKNWQQQIHISGNAFVERNITLQPAPVQMPEITIEEKRPQLRNQPRLAHQTISPRQMAIPPLLQDGDVFALIHHMPGVSGRDPDDIFPHIEGGSASEMAVEIDDIPIFVPTYSRNRRSLFATQILKSLQVLRAGYSAKHGEALTGIVAMQTADVSSTRPRFQAGLHTRGFSLGGQAKRGGVSWLAFGRRTRIHHDEFDLSENVTDFAQKLVLQPTVRQQIRLFSVIGRGAFTQSNSRRTPALLNSSTGLAYLIQLSKSATASFQVYHSTLQHRAQENGIKIKFQKTINPSLNFSSGLQFFKLHSQGDAVPDSIFQYKFTRPDFIEFDLFTENLFDQKMSLGTVYGELRLANENWQLRAGARLPHHAATGRSYFAPRLGIAFSAVKNLHLQLSSGDYLQFADRSYASEAKSGDGLGLGEFVAIADNSQPAKARHFRFESTLELPAGWAASMAIYRKNYNLNSRVYFIRLNDVAWLLPLRDGHASGIQAFVTKNTGPVQGWLSYTINSTVYKSSGGTTFIPYFQRKNIFQIALSNYVSAALQLRWHYAKYTGFPERLWGPDDIRIDPLLPAEDFAAKYLSGESRVGSRTRMAFGLSWKFRGPHKPHAVDFSIENTLTDRGAEIDDRFRFWAGYRFAFR